MDENAGNNKVLGMNGPSYVKVTYTLVLVSAGLGLLISILTTAGLGTPSGAHIVNLIGLIGWLMALVGWVAYAKTFTVIELSHLRFIAVLFVSILVGGIIIGAVLGANGLLWEIFSLVLSVGAAALLYLGFRLWLSREEATLDLLKAEFDTVKSRLTNRSDI